MGGILGRLDAEVQHGVVTRPLAVLPQTPAGDPHERVEPVNGSKHFRRHLNRPVAAEDVRELVSDHHARAILGPLVRRPWQNHPGPEEPPGDQHRGVIALQQQDRAAQRVSRRDRFRQLGPRALDHALSPRRDPGQPPQPDEQDQQADRDAGDPEGSGQVAVDQRPDASEVSEANSARYLPGSRVCGRALFQRLRHSHQRRRIETHLPGRHHPLHRRQRGRADNRRGKHQMPDRGRARAQEPCGAEREEQHQGDFDRARQKQRHHRTAFMAVFASSWWCYFYSTSARHVTRPKSRCQPGEASLTRQVEEPAASPSPLVLSRSKDERCDSWFDRLTTSVNGPRLRANGDRVQNHPSHV